MPIDVTVTAYGAAALDALAATVRTAKAGDPLAPVAVVVPTNTVGVMARRALGRRGGAAAIDVLTLFRLAELLAAPSLLDEGRKPVSTPVVDLAVKAVLARSPGLYGQVHRHPSTVVALRELYRELRITGPTAVTALSRTSRGCEPARVAADVARELAPAWYDEGDLLTRAAERASEDLPSRFTDVVVYLPERLRPLERALVRALASRGCVRLVVGATGDPAADAAVQRIITGLTGTKTELDVAPPRDQPAPVVDVMSTTDADDEVRLAVRALLDEARRGTPFDRMAVLWPTARPYARLVEHQLEAAGVPWNGRPGTATDERMVPRLLMELLEVDRRGLRRASLMALLGDVPAHGADGKPVSTTRWERMGRRAGIVRDDDWDRRWPILLADAARRGPAEVTAAERLQDFVAELRAALGDPQVARPWSGWARWCNERLERWFGRALDHLEGPERIAWEQTQRVLDRLAHLDSIGSPVTRAEFGATFIAELEVAPARHGKVGDGVHVGALAGAGGLDVDLAVVLGAADGLLPPPPEVDPLLGDHDRAAAGLVASTERVEVARRHFLGAMAAPHAVVTVPRGDLRVAAVHQPSRWLELVAARGTVRSSIQLDSHAHALAVTEFPVSEPEHRLRELWTRVRAGEDVRVHARASGDTVLQRSLLLRDERASERFTVFDGDVSSRHIPPISESISPTAVELWASCPHAYFVRHVLGVRSVDDPDDIESLTALDRGSAMHDAIDQLQQAVLAKQLPAPPPSGWTDLHRAELARIAEQIADELEAGGRTGRPAAWANERAALLAELDEWIIRDAAAWSGRRIRCSEHAFGEDGAVRVHLPDGRGISFAGKVDRVDELPGGGLVVTDHKTGRVASLAKLSAEDPTLGGTRFQLPVYAAAAAVLAGTVDAEVRAEYAFFRRGDFRRIGYTLDDATWKRVSEDLARVVDGIEAGFFPALPDQPGWRPFPTCRYCEPDGLGTAPRWAEWQRKRHDPRWVRWFPGEVDP